MRTWLVTVLACVVPVVAAGQSPPNERGPDDPIFVRWLDPKDPQDQTILHYWERAKRDQLTASELVDLGTMLHERGYPKDAVRTYKAALKTDSRLHEAWFRIGLVRHSQGEVDDARHAYRKCLKLLTGHGWCNFYLGLLEEQTGSPSKALDCYRRAFKFAPELADPMINPGLLYSDLYIGASLMHLDRERFADSLPMGYLEPNRVAAVRAQFEPTPTPTPTFTATSTASCSCRRPATTSTATSSTIRPAASATTAASSS